MTYETGLSTSLMTDPSAMTVKLEYFKSPKFISALHPWTVNREDEAEIQKRNIQVINKATTSIVYIYIYIYIMRVLVISKSLCGYESNQVIYNMESAQYLW